MRSRRNWLAYNPTSLELLSEIAPGLKRAAIIALGREPGGGLVVMPGGLMTAHRAPIILAAARNNLPAVYARSEFVRDGGLLSYGPDPVDNWRRAASYVDRICAARSRAISRCTVTLNTAKALDLAVPL